MKTLATKILAVTFCAFVALTVSTSIYAGNGTATQSTATQQNGTGVTSEQITDYMSGQGIKTASIAPANDGSSNVIVTTPNGKRIIVYINGGQFLGHDDLPQ
jgi:protein-disulfide isomerase